jgi:hypothetical protein
MSDLGTLADKFYEIRVALLEARLISEKLGLPDIADALNVCSTDMYEAHLVILKAHAPKPELHAAES